jgi:hypothetical protein
LAFAKTLEEGVDDRIDHDDSISQSVHNAFNECTTWREYVGNYYRDDCDDCIGATEYQLEMICDDLRDRADAVVKTTGYSDFDYDLTSWAISEVNEVVYINDHPLLKALYDRDDGYDLEFFLDIEDSGHEFVSYRGKYVSRGEYPSIDFKLITDKVYWWGHSHETMEEIYHEHVDCDD